MVSLVLGDCTFERCNSLSSITLCGLLYKCIEADGYLLLIEKSKSRGNFSLYEGEILISVSGSQPKLKQMCLISNGVFNAYGEMVKDAFLELRFKMAKNRDADQYKSLRLNDKVSFHNAVAMYQIITGACKPGIKTYLESLPEVKKEYTVSEIIEITKGQYRSEMFREFFRCE